MSKKCFALILISCFFASAYSFLFSTSTNTEPNFFLYTKINKQNGRFLTLENIKQ